MDAAGIKRRLSAALSPSMLNGDRDGKMQGTRHRGGQIYAAHKRKRRLRFRKRRFLIQTSKEENFLSLAGLAATYSPRA
jgi:hypothetical protein